ncbi:type IV secretion protein Rhs [Duganella radicis]|uniref:Type IV secretion protein Rhs n=1 Tax=Duganella radicis TaxID=551988 RepID=A0A6L6PS58_9BURK|nr:type IV secretion protein Rhs [Duganella radicis]MTV41477.1 type IV secretion protein Rhs [Duganella radicis]
MRQEAMLQDNVGYNISPTSWDAYPTIGRNGTFVSDRAGVIDYFGDVAGKTNITVPANTASQIEADMGLVPGTLQGGFKIRQVTGIQGMFANSPMEGNQFFLGAGNHLPGGAPEMVIQSIPTVDNHAVQTILKVKVGP